MISEWRRLPLGELVRFVSGSTPSKKEGAYWGGDIPWVSAKDMKSFLLSDSEDKITSLAKESGAKVVPAGTVLILTRGMTLLNDVPICLLNTESSFNQDVKAISPTDTRLSATYLPYALLGRKRELMSLVDLAGHGTGRLATDLLNSFEIDLPSLGEQKLISNLLGSIDNKIELNRKTNETLEGIAKALFKSWFVDFDPVRAKAEGRPTGLPDEISELFPDSLEESELGEIPTGWGCRQLRELIESIKERQGGRLLEEFSATVTGIEPRDDRFKKNLAKSSNKNRVAHEGDLVFGLSRRVINFGRMPRSIGAFSPVYEVFRSLPGAPVSTKFIEEQIRQRMSEFMIILKPAAREGQAIDREILLDQSVSIAPGKVIAAFEVLANLVESRMRSLAEDICVLEQIRDALLPRLISGELRVPDAEKMLEEVGI